MKFKPTLSLFMLLFGCANNSLAQGPKQFLEPWQEGMLDLHHINTGRGDAAFCIFPDGTTLLIDAGDMSETHPRTNSARNARAMPNDSRSAPSWIVDYIKQFHPKTENTVLDYALITHYHDDHFGEMDSLRKQSDAGYYLTGITEVGTMLPIKKMLDRGFDFPIDLKNDIVQAKHRFVNDPYGMLATLKEYWKFLAAGQANGGLVNETLKAGYRDQIALLYGPKKFPAFSVRNIAVNGQMWTGENQEAFTIFAKGEYPGENPLSICIKISYGDFDYFTGGDISGINAFGETDMFSVESQIAPVIGPVDVATLNHHGNRDSQNAYYVRTIRPRVWIQQNWSSDHPGEEVLRRITSKVLYPGPRDIFATVMLQPNKDVIGTKLEEYKGQNGHIVVRTAKGGGSYHVYVLNDASEEREILSIHGPYECR